jgi:hypothetical protein
MPLAWQVCICESEMQVVLEGTHSLQMPLEQPFAQG